MTLDNSLINDTFMYPYAMEYNAPLTPVYNFNYNFNTNSSNNNRMFVNDGGFNSGMSGISGVPTRTTSTLTPTTLRNIEQTFQDLQNDLSQSGPYSAGFVPPPAPINQNQNQLTVLTNNNNSNINSLPPYQPPMRQQQQHHQQQQQSQAVMIPSFLNEMEPNSMESMDSSSMSDTGSWQTPPPTGIDDMINGNKGRPRNSYASPGSSSSNSNPKPTRRNAGGRKPNKSNLSPEEEEKRRVRRERNKQAAARCRRRREDHTSELQGQVDDMEDKKRALTAEIQQMNQLRDELYEIIEKHKTMNHCVIGDRQSPPDVKPTVMQSNRMTATVPLILPVPTVPLQRPTNFNTNIVNSNNNNNNTMNANKLALKIKAEPLDDFYDEDEPPRKRKCDMLSGQEFDITTPTTPYMPQLNTPPTFMKSQKPNRPSSLNVPANLKPSDFLARRNVADIAGVSVNTPSSGMFNFDSLMEGGTGLTPVNPLIPCSTQNRNPMDMLQTPTSEPSKLVSL